MMKVLKYVKDNFPDWYKSIDSNHHYLVLTNDIDSYLSCMYLKHRTGIQIGGYYDFKTLYINKTKAEGKEPIYVDCDVTNGLSFGNHVTTIKNSDCINLNKLIVQDNYQSKYAGSTLFTLFSLYEEDISKLNPNMITVLLTTDVWFKQFFHFRDRWDYWVKVMQLEGLTDIVQRHEASFYYDLLIKYRLNSKVLLDGDGSVVFDMDYDGISNDYGLIVPRPKMTFEHKALQLETRIGYPGQVLLDAATVFSNAQIYRNKALYSVIC
jgi:hypothetical protein